MLHQTALDLMRFINAKQNDPRLTVRIVQTTGTDSKLRITHADRKGVEEIQSFVEAAKGGWV